MYIFDTCVFTAYFNKDTTTIDRINGVPLDHRFLSAVTVWEVVHGCNKKIEEQRSLCLKGKRNTLVLDYRDLLGNFYLLSRTTVVPYSDEVHTLYLSLPAQFRVKSRSDDSRIAATAIKHRLTVATFNYDDFKDIPGLSVEDWR